MIFYKLLCIPPNLEIFLTGVYTLWCLCSSEILSWYNLLDKINVCWSTINPSGENSILTTLRYSVSSLHIFQFVFAYIMLAAEILTIYPILFNKSAALLNPIIMASTVRQIYSNSVAIVLGALLCYFSESSFDEFQCFFGRFLVNMIVSYYIIFSYGDFQRYVQGRSSSLTAVEDAQRKKPVIWETKSENSFITDSNYRRGKKFELCQQNSDAINRMESFTSKRTKQLLPSEMDVHEDVNSMLSTSSIRTNATMSNSKETFHINFINRKTKAKLLSFKIEKQN